MYKKIRMLNFPAIPLPTALQAQNSAAGQVPANLFNLLIYKKFSI
jgi:hypothetical protein